MIDLEIAASDWRHAFMQSEMKRVPNLWVGHYGPEWLGAVWDSTITKDTMYYLASPFAFSSEVSDTFIVENHQRVLTFTRISKDGNGVRITGWKVPYRVGDRGEVSMGVATKRNDLDSMADKICQHLGQHRLTRSHFHTFDDALAAAIESAT